MLCILINLLKEASLSSTFPEDQKVIFFLSFITFGVNLGVTHLCFDTYLKIKNCGYSCFDLLLYMYLQFGFIIKCIILSLKIIYFCKLFLCLSIKKGVSFLMMDIQILEFSVKQKQIEKQSLLIEKH